MSQNHDCACNEYTMLPVRGFGLAVDTSGLPSCGGLEERIKELEEAVRRLCPFTLCEFYFFRNPALRPGFELAQGGLVENAAELYPEAWAYLQTAEGRALCTTEEEWQAMTHATWATLADGTQVGWDGIGGAPFYAPDMATGALRLPDIRGMYMEAAGFDGLDVGGVHGDGIRNITGRFHTLYNALSSGAGAFVVNYRPDNGVWIAHEGADASYRRATLDPSRVVPTANKNAPRAFGVLPCVYLGAPR